MSHPHARPCIAHVLVAAPPSSHDVPAVAVAAAVPTCVGSVTESWASLADKQEDDEVDAEEVAPMTPQASRSSSISAQPPCMGREAEESGGWQEVLPRRGLRRPASPSLALPPRPIPAWLSGRCCRCLVHGHRAAICNDPLRCSRCLKNGHRARECCNPWRPLSSLACLAMPPVSSLGAVRCHAPASCMGPAESTPSSKAVHFGSWASVVSAPVNLVPSSEVASQSALAAQVEQLQVCLARVGLFLERAEAA
jgi:hypothetical protein